MTNPINRKRHFAVSCIYREIYVDDPERYTPSQKILLGPILVDDEDDAQIAVEEMAKAQEYECPNESGELIRWTLVEIELIREVWELD